MSKRTNDCPICLDLGDGTTRYISVDKANKIIRDLHKQLDAMSPKVKTKRDFHRIVGENIRRERGVLHLTADYVVKKTDLSKSFLSEVEIRDIFEKMIRQVEKLEDVRVAGELLGQLGVARGEPVVEVRWGCGDSSA